MQLPKPEKKYMTKHETPTNNTAAAGWETNSHGSRGRAPAAGGRRPAGPPALPRPVPGPPPAPSTPSTQARSPGPTSCGLAWRGPRRRRSAFPCSAPARKNAPGAPAGSSGGAPGGAVPPALVGRAPPPAPRLA